MPPFGVLTGQSGARVESFIIRDGERIDFATPGKVGGFPMREGDRLILQSAGGGGYGDPLTREIHRVSEDLRAGLISSQAAKDVYGVVLKEDGTIDPDASKERRANLSKARTTMQAVITDLECYKTVGYSRKRICRVNPADAKCLDQTMDDCIEILGSTGTPLRAWIELDASVKIGQLPLDRLGLGVLGAQVGDKVQIRPLMIPAVT